MENKCETNKIYAKAIVFATFFYPMWKIVCLVLARYEEPSWSRLGPISFIFFYNSKLKSKLNMEYYWIAMVVAITVDYNVLSFEPFKNHDTFLLRNYFIGNFVTTCGIIFVSQNKKILFSYIVFTFIAVLSFFMAQKIYNPVFYNQLGGIMEFLHYLTVLVITGAAAYSKIQSQENLTRRLIESQELTIQKNKMASLGEMAGGIAHEINNPLQILAGNIELLEMENLDRPEIVYSLKDTTDRIHNIVKGLKSFSRSDEGLEFKSIEINQVLESTLQLCQEKFKMHNIKIIKNIPADLIISGNNIQISQVFLNLLNNAFDAIEEKNSIDNKYMKIIAEKENGKVKISFQDSGVGISKEFVDKIGQPFYTTKKIGKGTGLGMSVSLGILNKHQANMKISLEPKTFSLEFPCV
jgi:signal transduction histidine kinase